jgi:hypothetical protein
MHNITNTIHVYIALTSAVAFTISSALFAAFIWGKTFKKKLKEKKYGLSEYQSYKEAYTIIVMGVLFAFYFWSLLFHLI